MGKYKVLHYKKDCISCGACAAICPEFWEMDEDGLAQLKGSSLIDDHWELEINSEEDRAKNQEAEEACPAQIIKVKPHKK